MNKQYIYKRLEDKMLGYADYVNVPLQVRRDRLVPITEACGVLSQQIDNAMLAYTGSDVYVRTGVLKRLTLAAKRLATEDKRLQLEVVYGYRALDIQQQLFEKYMKSLSSRYEGGALFAAVHRLVAVPKVAGHPAGAAVDIRIVCDGQSLDFGTAVHAFVPDSYTFSPFVGREAWRNRQLLRSVMLYAGFAPFDGEWWHFSYGDKEWARYYGQPYACYQQLEFRSK